jgi:hypothetical protein
LSKDCHAPANFRLAERLEMGEDSLMSAFLKFGMCFLTVAAAAALGKDHCTATGIVFAGPDASVPMTQPLSGQIVQPLPGQGVQPLPGQIVQPLPGQIVQPLSGQVVGSLPCQYYHRKMRARSR